MLLSLLVVSSMGVAALACDLEGVPEESAPLARRLCVLEQEMHVVENVLGELLNRVELSTEESLPAMEKRKNEFIRFGKRSGGDVEKRKNEFIRFGKRKNEFIRFGRSAPSDMQMEKRKNEFIRFG